MGYNFGLWVTLWINIDADNYQFAATKGYLLKSKTDPSQPCTRHLVERHRRHRRPRQPRRPRLVRRAAAEPADDLRRRRVQVRHALLRRVLRAAPGYTALDYLKLGAQLTDEFDQQGAGVRIHWTGSQKYGFVTRQVDKGTDWASLRAAVAPGPRDQHDRLPVRRDGHDRRLARHSHRRPRRCSCAGRRRRA